MLALLALVVACAEDDDRHYPVIPSNGQHAVGQATLGSSDAGVRDAGPIVVDGKTLPPTDAQAHPDATPPTDANVLPDAQL